MFLMVLPPFCTSKALANKGFVKVKPLGMARFASRFLPLRRPFSAANSRGQTLRGSEAGKRRKPHEVETCWETQENLDVGLWVTSFSHFLCLIGNFIDIS